MSCASADGECSGLHHICCTHVALVVPAAAAGMVTTNWSKFNEYKANGLVKDVFHKQDLLDSLKGGWAGELADWLDGRVRWPGGVWFFLQCCRLLA